MNEDLPCDVALEVVERGAHVAGVRRYDLTDAQWQRLKPLLLPARPRTGWPNHPQRTILNGILWILRAGAPWRDLPERYGPVGGCRAGSTAGMRQAYGTGYSQRCNYLIKALQNTLRGGGRPHTGNVGLTMSELS